MADITAPNQPHIKLPSLSVWMKRTYRNGKAGAWVLDRVSTMTDSFTQNISFHKSPRPEDCLIPDINRCLQTYLPQSDAPLVLTASDFELDSHGVMLKGLAVTGQELRKGVQRVILSFKRFVGSINALFLPGHAPSLLQDTQNDLAARTLNDIVMPVLNLAVADPMAVGKHSKALSERLSLYWGRLAQNKAEIEFYCTLILRFIARQSAPTSKTQIGFDQDTGPSNPPKSD